MSQNSHTTRINQTAEFLPQTNDDERPALRVNDALVFAYLTEDDGGNVVLRVTVDLDDVELDGAPLGVQVAVGDEVVYEA